MIRRIRIHQKQSRQFAVKDFPQATGHLFPGSTFTDSVERMDYLIADFKKLGDQLQVDFF